MSADQLPFVLISVRDGIASASVAGGEARVLVDDLDAEADALSEKEVAHYALTASRDGLPAVYVRVRDGVAEPEVLDGRVTLVKIDFDTLFDYEDDELAELRQLVAASPLPAAERQTILEQLDAELAGRD